MNLNTFLGWNKHTRAKKNQTFAIFEFPNHNPHFTALWLAKIKYGQFKPHQPVLQQGHISNRKIEDLKTVWHSTLTYLARTSSLVSCFFHTVASEGSRGLSLFASLVTLSHRAYREDFYSPHTYETWKARRATHRVFHSKLDNLNCL